MNIQNISTSIQNSKLYNSSIKSYESGKKYKAEKPTSLNKISEEVEISNISNTIKKVKDKIDSLPEVRIEMVEEIKKKIKNNDYPLENKNLNDALRKMVEHDIVYSEVH